MGRLGLTEAGKATTALWKVSLTDTETIVPPVVKKAGRGKAKTSPVSEEPEPISLGTIREHFAEAARTCPGAHSLSAEIGHALCLSYGPTDPFRAAAALRTLLFPSFVFFLRLMYCI